MRGTLEPRSWDAEKEQLVRVRAFFQGGNPGCGGRLLPALSPWIQITNDPAWSPGSVCKRPRPGELVLVSDASGVTTELRTSLAGSVQPRAGNKPPSRGSKAPGGARVFPGPALPHGLPQRLLQLLPGCAWNCGEARPARGSDTRMPPGAFYQRTALIGQAPVPG